VLLTIQTERHADQGVEPLQLKLSALTLADRSVQIDGPAQKVSNSRWYGYAVGHWEGDTFVVNSNNFNDATWLDQYGSPHSDQMIVEERYHRLDHDHLEMILNIADPKTYVGTWKGDKKIFQLVEKPARSEFNDLPENICAFSEVKLHGKAWQQIHL
jgi:hypothetical protein